MAANGLTNGALVSNALELTPCGPYRETLGAANRAVSNAVDFSLTTGVLIVVSGVFLFIILMLLAERRTERKAMAAREAARDKAADERYKIDAARQDKDIASHDNLAQALQELSILIESRICNPTPPPTTPTPTPRLLAAPSHGDS